jgi:hypothetical protein
VDTKLLVEVAELDIDVARLLHAKESRRYHNGHFTKRMLRNHNPKPYSEDYKLEQLRLACLLSFFVVL